MHWSERAGTDFCPFCLSIYPRDHTRSFFLFFSFLFSPVTIPDVDNPPDLPILVCNSGESTYPTSMYLQLINSPIIMDPDQQKYHEIEIGLIPRSLTDLNCCHWSSRSIQSNHYYSVHTACRPLAKRNKGEKRNAKISLFLADDESNRVMASTE